MKRVGLLTAGAIVVFIVRCALGPQTAGNSTEVGNGVIAGTLYLPDSTRAAGVRVVIRPRATLADTSRLGLSKRMADTASAVTDASGRFVIDSIDTGTYVIEAASGNNAVFIDSVVVKRTDSTLNLPPDTLKPAGAIKGVIRLSEGGDPRKVFILAFGIDRFTGVKADGRFRFQGLAEASYRLRIISTLDDYGVVDTVTTVRSADTTDLGVIELPFTGIPTVKGLRLSYDTLRQIVTLTWNRADTAVVTGYNVYRQHEDSGLVKLNSAPITDTTYADTTALQDNYYTYQIKALDKGGNEGLLSADVGITVVSKFAVTDTIGSFGTAAGQFTSIWDMACDKAGNLYAVSCENNTGNNPRIQKFDGSRKTLLSIGTKGVDSVQFQEPKGIAVDQRQWIYVTDRGNSRVQVFDSTGAFVRSIYGQLSDSSQLLYPKEIAVDDSAIYVADYSNSEYFSTVKKFDLNGGFLLKWGTKGDAPGQFRMIWSIKVTSKGELAILDQNGIQFFTKNGAYLRRIPTSTFGNVQDFDIRDTTIYASSNEGKVIFLSEVGDYLATFDSKRNDLFQIATTGQEIFLYYFDSSEIIVLK